MVFYNKNILHASLLSNKYIFIINKGDTMSQNSLTWTFFTDVKGEWRWRSKSTNGKIVGASSEGFTSKQNAIKNAKLNGYEG